MSRWRLLWAQGLEGQAEKAAPVGAFLCLRRSPVTGSGEHHPLPPPCRLWGWGWPGPPGCHGAPSSLCTTRGHAPAGSLGLHHVIPVTGLEAPTWSSEESVPSWRLYELEQPDPKNRNQDTANFFCGSLSHTSPNHRGHALWEGHGETPGQEKS